LWLLFLTEINETTKVVPKALLENAETREAISYMDVGAYTKAQLATYDKFRDVIMTERSLLGDATRRGEAIGRAEGETIGRAEGEAIGRAEGRTEGEMIGEANQRKKTVLNGHQANLPIETIAVITNFSPEEVKKIIEENSKINDK
jgi:predicted transposase YdaD